LQDFVGVDGSPGYFEQELMVYGRAGDTCDSCGEFIRKVVISQRATYYCNCQT
jgi:formamidopyrimidine-DNA glycosylase